MTCDVDQREGDSVRNFSGRFVILTHDHPFLHWDLMLEDAGVLRTWRLLQEPAPGVIIAAEPLSDHRLHYLDYEGPVSGDRGTVNCWDRGQHQTTAGPTRLTSAISGERIEKGTIILIAGGDLLHWTFQLVAVPSQVL